MNNELNVASKEMPKYQCHKQVWALKIKSILYDSPKTQDLPNGGQVAECGRSAELTPEESDYAPFRVDENYISKHNPQVGGYYVVYPDGYKSFSPSYAFEDGYTLIK